MARLPICLATITLTAVAAACAPSPSKARHTVQAYRADAALRRDQIMRCANDPGTLGRTPDCINAGEAQRLEGIGSFKDRFQPKP